jgi:hypothetical protein
MHTGLHVKCPLFLSDFNETWIFSAQFRKILHIKLHENLSSGSRVVPCGQTDRHDEANDIFDSYGIMKTLVPNLLHAPIHFCNVFQCLGNSAEGE